MKKIDFDYAQGKFSIESDDSDATEFIKEYVEVFCQKLLERNYQSAIDSNRNDAIEIPARKLETEETAPSTLSKQEDIINVFGITARQLAYLIDFSNESIKIIVRNKILKGTKAEMQVKLSLLYCGACEYKGIKANTKEIRNICTEYQCLDGNFAQNIKKQNYFNISGAVNADIVLTMPGKDRLLDVVREIYNAIEESNNVH